jgi:hypothetical protein
VGPHSPDSLRARMIFDSALTSVVLRQLVAAVSSWLRRARARRPRARRSATVRGGVRASGTGITAPPASSAREPRSSPVS